MNVEGSSVPGRRPAVLLVALVLLLGLVGPIGLLLPDALAAQATAEARQMRHFWHVFAAYAIAWVLIFAWLVSILRRLRRVEERLTGGS